MMVRQYELKLSDNRRVIWEGKDGQDAARRFVSSHPDKEVIAFRNHPRHGLFIGNHNHIKEN